MKIVSSITVDSWSDFISSHPKGNIFQTPEMFNVYKKTKKHEPVFLAVIDEGGGVIATLLAVIQKEHNGILGKFSSRSIIIGGPLVKDCRSSVLDLILNEYNRVIKARAIYSQVRNMWLISQAEKLIYSKYDCVYEPHLDIHISLKEKELLFKNISRNKRRNVTKSFNKGASIKEIVNVDVYENALQLVYATYKRIKLPVADRTFFINAFEELTPKGMLKCFGLYSDDVCVGMRVQLLYNGLVYDWYAGSNDDFKHLYINDVLPYHVLEWGSDNGYHTFDFGGAGKPGIPYGVRDHKMKFGGELVEFGRFEKVHNKPLMFLGKIALSLYKTIK